MGCWNDIAAEIERVLGDELNPTDAYGRPIVREPRSAVPLMSGESDFGFGRFQVADDLK